jgi:hypothetical protein
VAAVEELAQRQPVGGGVPQQQPRASVEPLHLDQHAQVVAVGQLARPRGHAGQPAGAGVLTTHRAAARNFFDN